MVRSTASCSSPRSRGSGVFAQATASIAASCNRCATSRRRARGPGSAWSRAASSEACLGHQIGSGRGNTVATIAGAGAGAYAGNEIEKNKKGKSYWAVAIRMDNGATRNFTYTSKPTVHEGERVKLVDGGRRLALLAN
jgi:uncharacterized protein YcfJ